jgi:hypothetical protein
LDSTKKYEVECVGVGRVWGLKIEIDISSDLSKLSKMIEEMLR